MHKTLTQGLWAPLRAQDPHSGPKILKTRDLGSRNMKNILRRLLCVHCPSPHHILLDKGAMGTVDHLTLLQLLNNDIFRVSKELFLVSFNVVIIAPLFLNIYSLVMVTYGGILEKWTEMEKKQILGKWFILSFILFLYVSYGDGSCLFICVALLNNKCLSRNMNWSRVHTPISLRHAWNLTHSMSHFLVDIECCEDNCASYRGSLAESVSQFYSKYVIFNFFRFLPINDP